MATMTHADREIEIETELGTYRIVEHRAADLARLAELADDDGTVSPDSVRRCFPAHVECHCWTSFKFVAQEVGATKIAD